MRLVQLTIRRGVEVVRTIEFKIGLNLILDTPTTESIQSGNNVGKTTMLRLIDFCLGSDGTDIWQDAEFKGKNQEVFDFLHGALVVTVDLELESVDQRKYLTSREFNASKKSSSAFMVNGDSYRNLSEYRKALRSILFDGIGTKPSLRQLIPKFVRSSPDAMSRTLKFLTAFTSEADYEAIHLFLFGYLASDVLEERPRLQRELQRLDRDIQALTRLRKEGEIEQLLLHLNGELRELTLATEARGEVPEIAARADRVSAIRARAAERSGALSGIEAEINSIDLAIGELREEYERIDSGAIEKLYQDAQQYIPDLHRDWDELRGFIENLRGRKERFLKRQADALSEDALRVKAELNALGLNESLEIGELYKSRAFNTALSLRVELQEKLKRVGSLEQNLADIRNLRSQIKATEDRIESTKEQIDQWREALRDNVATFNRYFSRLSKELYGEEYLLHFDETEKGSIAFRLSSVGSNVGAGKKTSQTAAFDLAYTYFLRATKIPFPLFACHDGLESIHDNQLAALLHAADAMDGQLVVATLRDKLPVMEGDFIVRNTILELSHDDRLFRL